jgi:isopentenyl-diphosphate delta-isomerase
MIWSGSMRSCGKITAHREGKLHRAFSILITNQDGELLLQRRAAHKYHFANHWSNACCGHPRPGESTSSAARRRLVEELGFSVPLTEVAELSYCARDPVSGLVEYEYLHVFHGLYAGDPSPNPHEVAAWRWMLPDRVRRGLAARPDWFTLSMAGYQSSPSSSRMGRKTKSRVTTFSKTSISPLCGQCAPARAPGR